MRNKRGIGHVGGDLDANSIDISAMAKVADWTVCELIRLYHGLSLEEAQDIVDGLAVRQLPTRRWDDTVEPTATKRFWPLRFREANST
jgi:hypothetical protein